MVGMVPAGPQFFTLTPLGAAIRVGSAMCPLILSLDTRNHMKIILLLLIAIGMSYGEDKVMFTKFVIVDAIFKNEVDVGGKPTQVIKRYVVKSPVVINIGNKLYLSGKTALENNIKVPGSNFDALYIPIDNIVAMGGFDDPKALVANEIFPSEVLGKIVN